ncbi:MAG: hypothetical protein ABW127_18520 [Candidatus Thiodiazotropha endolucinida]
MISEIKKTVDRLHNSTWFVILMKLGIIVIVLVLANFGVSRIVDSLGIQMWPQYMEIVDRAVLIGILLYICLMATPFLPGVEIGLTLMVVLGPKGVLIVYGCTLVALTIAFFIGRATPAHLLVALLQWLHMVRAATLIQDLNQIPAKKRVRYLMGRANMKSLRSLLKHRYLILAVLLNLPGNTLVGGGGGIAMAAGMSRLYPFSVYIIVVAIAILPVPLFFILFKSV